MLWLVNEIYVIEVKLHRFKLKGETIEVSDRAIGNLVHNVLKRICA